MPIASLSPAVIESCNGTAYSPVYGDCYHTSTNSLHEKHALFLHGNQLPKRWLATQRFQILEVGFGLGLNFLLTWQEWRKSAPSDARLHYFSAELHPPLVENLRLWHARWPALAELAIQLQAAWPVLTPGFHRRTFDRGRITLTLMFDEAAQALQQADVHADAIFLDGFAPERNPAAWSTEVARALPRIAADQATLTAGHVAPQFTDALARAGFALTVAPNHGQPALHGVFRPRRQVSHPGSPRRVAVIGAGLAGCTVAAKLAERGWQVQLLEQHALPSSAASGNLAGAFGPQPSLDDNVFSRWVRAGLLYGLHHREQLALAGFPVEGAQCGMLQLAKDAEDAELQQRVAQRQAPWLLRWADTDEACALAGQTVAGPGLFHPLAGWLHPASLCQALCRRHALELLHARVIEVRALDNGWQLLTSQGGTLAADDVVFAGGADHHFAALTPLPLQGSRGQVSYLPSKLPLHCVLGREGYLIPHRDGWMTLGATYQLGNVTTLPDEASHTANQQRLSRLLPDWTAPDRALWQGRAALRSVTPDRLPLLGALPDFAAPAQADQGLAGLPRRSGLWTCLGFGSRGLVWAHLAAEVLAAQMSAEPAPLERELVSAVDPARFRLRQLRQTKPTLG